MPTASIAGLMVLNNIGNLTTTFTAPSSCATASKWTGSGLAYPGLDAMLYFRVDNCGDAPDASTDCMPSGDVINRLAESPDRVYHLNYYSPGLYCPDAWTTVGVYAPGQYSPDSTAAASPDLGIFRPTTFDDGRSGEATFPTVDYAANMFTSALAPTETAIVCCPSGFSIDPLGGCYSNFPVSKLAGKTACFSQATVDDWLTEELFTRTFEYWGETTTIRANNVVLETNTDYYTTVTVTFDESGVPRETGGSLTGPIGVNDLTKQQGVAAVSPIYLVHGGEAGGSDVEDREKEGDGQTENNKTEDGDGDDDSAAGRPFATWGPADGVRLAWVFSVAAGFGLLVAW